MYKNVFLSLHCSDLIFTPDLCKQSWITFLNIFFLVKILCSFSSGFRVALASFIFFSLETNFIIHNYILMYLVYYSFYHFFNNNKSFQFTSSDEWVNIKLWNSQKSLCLFYKSYCFPNEKPKKNVFQIDFDVKRLVVNWFLIPIQLNYL